MSYEANKKWRLAHPERRNKDRRARYAQTSFAPKGHRPWTGMEVARVLAGDATDRELAAELGRSEQAVQQKRWRLTKPTDESSGA